MGNEILQNTSPEAQKKEKRNSIIITVCVILAAALIMYSTVLPTPVISSATKPRHKAKTLKSTAQ